VQLLEKRSTQKAKRSESPCGNSGSYYADCNQFPTTSSSPPLRLLPPLLPRYYLVWSKNLTLSCSSFESRKSFVFLVHILGPKKDMDFLGPYPFQHTHSQTHPPPPPPPSPLPSMPCFRWRVCSHIDDLARCWIWVSIGTSWLTSTSILQFNML
jgi:hypothetical protein